MTKFSAPALAMLVASVAAMAACGNASSGAPVSGAPIADTPTATRAASSASPSAAQTAAVPKPSVTVYKSPTCGCCELWVGHMRANGFDVKALDVEDVDAVKRTYGVPPSVDSCHTALVDGFVIEGHVPADAVSRLLRERPPVAGIAVGGMPIGSPGMEVPGVSEPYVISSFDKKGQTAVYDRR